MAEENLDPGATSTTTTGAPTKSEPATTTTTTPAKGDASATSHGTNGEASGAAGKEDQGGYWPRDWREKAANGDAKTLDALSRYASPTEVAKAMRAAQVKISSGELKTALPKNPSPEELVDWRKANGIPEKPEKYDLDLGKGFVIADVDKPLINDFLKVAHETNQTPEQVKSNLRAYYAIQEKITADLAAKDQQTFETTQNELIAEWGTEYRANLNRITQHLDRVADKGLKDKLLAGRLADGTPIGSSPAALKMLLGLALMENPTGVLVPSGAGPAGVDDEIKTIETFMQKHRGQYNKDEKMQERYRQLIDARETMKPRKAA